MEIKITLDYCNKLTIRSFSLMTLMTCYHICFKYRTINHYFSIVSPVLQYFSLVQNKLEENVIDFKHAPFTALDY